MMFIDDVILVVRQKIKYMMSQDFGEKPSRPIYWKISKSRIYLVQVYWTGEWRCVGEIQNGIDFFITEKMQSNILILNWM